MQYHLDGYKPGEPRISAEAGRTRKHSISENLPEKVDVLIVGCGPAG